MHNQEPKEIITKETIDQELMEKAMVDQKIVAILDQVELVLILILVGVMVYLTYIKVRDFIRKKRKDQEDLLEESKRKLERDYYQNQNRD